VVCFLYIASEGGLVFLVRPDLASLREKELGFGRGRDVGALDLVDRTTPAGPVKWVIKMRDKPDQERRSLIACR